MRWFAILLLTGCTTVGAVLNRPLDPLPPGWTREWGHPPFAGADGMTLPAQKRVICITLEACEHEAEHAWEFHRTGWNGKWRFH